VLQQRARADYLVHLMPLMKKGIDARLAGRPKLVEASMTLGQYQVLDHLAQQGPQTMGELAHWGGVALSSMTATIQRLVGVGIVTRVRDDRDRRVVRIRVTDKGQRECRIQHRRAREHIEALLKTLSETEQKQMISAFRTLERILGGDRTRRSTP